MVLNAAPSQCLFEMVVAAYTIHARKSFPHKRFNALSHYFRQVIRIQDVSCVQHPQVCGYDIGMPRLSLESVLLEEPYNALDDGV